MFSKRLEKLFTMTEKTLLQFEKEYGELYLDDFPVEYENTALRVKLFNLLPLEIKFEYVTAGYDTVVREKIFEFLCYFLFDLTTEEYYKSDIAKNYFENGIALNDIKITEREIEV